MWKLNSNSLPQRTLLTKRGLMVRDSSSSSHRLATVVEEHLDGDNIISFARNACLFDNLFTA